VRSLICAVTRPIASGFKNWFFGRYNSIRRSQPWSESSLALMLQLVTFQDLFIEEAAIEHTTRYKNETIFTSKWLAKSSSSLQTAQITKSRKYSAGLTGRSKWGPFWPNHPMMSRVGKRLQKLELALSPCSYLPPPPPPPPPPSNSRSSPLRGLFSCACI
jgi:hypothetical protein